MDAAVGFNFVTADADQSFLMPPDMRDWLPADHLAWFVIDVVEQLELTDFRAAYRADGHGRAAYDPAVLVAVLLYSYCVGWRSSRVVERRCREDVALRVLARGLAPDHVTIARFRARHAEALAGVFVDSLRLCAAAGLVRLGTVALDGTKLAAPAARNANRTLPDLRAQVEAILAEAEAVDAAEDHAGDDGGLPPEMRDRQGRLARLRAAKAQLEHEAAQRETRFAERCEQVNTARAAKGQPPRVLRPRPWDEAPRPGATANTTDPDSRLMRGQHGLVQGYNCQIVSTAEQIIVAAETTQDGNDVTQLAPMIAATNCTLDAAGIVDRPDGLAADAGYWRAGNVDGSLGCTPELFIPVARHGRRGRPRKDGRPAGGTTAVLVAAMNARMSSDTGKAASRLRRTTVEPLFGQIKSARNISCFTRRGLPAAQAEWKLIAATSNLLKLYRHQTAIA